MRFFFNGDGDEVEKEKEEGDVQQSIFQRIDADAKQVLHNSFEN